MKGSREGEKGGWREKELVDQDRDPLASMSVSSTQHIDVKISEVMRPTKRPIGEFWVGQTGTRSGRGSRSARANELGMHPVKKMHSATRLQTPGRSSIGHSSQEKEGRCTK
jgi:hypothetical protein